ncbi:hypothetical protein ACWGIB_27505 [Streptomyces xiamenensis]
MDTSSAEAATHMKASIAHALAITDPAARARVIRQILDATDDPALARARATVLRALADAGHTD